MRIRPLSDLHLEFHRDKGEAFIKSLDPKGVDLLVLAGDIAKMSVGFYRVLSMFRKQFDCPIVYVHGNHDFWGSSRAEVLQATRDSVSHLRGVHWLDCESVEIEGHRILGAPLWYGRSRPPPGMMSTDEEWARGIRRFYHPGAKCKIVSTWPDFEEIQGFGDWVYEENARAQKFFLDNLREGDIAVTHMLPSRQCVQPKFERSTTNCFFVSDMTPLIEDRKPALWLHGHTHESVDFRLGATRIVCNPFGYAPGPSSREGEVNPRCDLSMVVEVPDLTITKTADTPEE